VYCDGGGALDNCAINGNSASDDGGGVYLSGGEGGPYGALDHCTISSNSASDGGGVYCEGGTLDHCAINGNSASASGGGYCGGGTLNNCLIAGNSAGGGWDGGGVYCWGSTLNNCTIAGNSADPGRCGGVYVDEGGTLSNSIAYFNTPAGADIGSNYAYTANNCCSPGLSGSGNITNNPQFMGGTNYHLQATSPCIDAGNNAYMPSATDLDGTPRPLDGDANGTAIVDMGCYEFVNGNADSDGDTMKDGWEQDHGLDPTDPSDASANPDNDPFNNRDEHTADTDPTNAASYFHVAAISNLPPPTVSFLSSSNRKYTLHGLTNLVLGVWTNVPGAGPRAGKGGADSMQDTNVPAKGPFYRLTVDLP
jgi:predicted outer membrane repeat protein